MSNQDDNDLFRKGHLPEDPFADSVPLGPDGEPWTRPVPLCSAGDLLPFPCDVFPFWLREFVAAVAETTQTPPDMAGTLALSVLATACAKKYRLELNADWTEPLCLYTLTIMETGERKSPVFAKMTKPIRMYERDRAKLDAPMVSKRALERSVLVDRIKAERKKAARAESDEERQEHEAEAHRLELELIARPALFPLRLLVDDCTPEKLSDILEEQGGRIALLTSEGGPFDMMAGRYSRPGMGNFEVYLKGYSGEDVRVDRVSRPAVLVRGATITVGITAQPDVLRDMASGPGFDGRGLLARFLYSVPRSRMGKRNTRPDPIPPSVRSAYQARVMALLAVPTPEEPRRLLLSPEADRAFDAYRVRLEEQRNPGGRLLPVKGWAAKLEGQTARIAALLHLADLASIEVIDHALVVPLETMERAIRLGWYFLEHAKAAFGEMRLDSSTGEAVYLLDRARSLERPVFSKRDLFNVARGRFGRVADMEPALGMLVERDYLCPVEPDHEPSPGRRPSPSFSLNPLA